VILDEGVFALILLALLAYCVFDVIRTDAASVQNLPKLVWLMLVIFLGPLGCVAWLLLGRPSATSFKLAAPEIRRRAPRPDPEPPAPKPAMSDDEFRRRREETLRRYEEERQQRDTT
jgi:hypothetical protein